MKDYGTARAPKLTKLPQRRRILPSVKPVVNTDTSLRTYVRTTAGQAGAVVMESFRLAQLMLLTVPEENVLKD